MGESRTTDGHMEQPGEVGAGSWEQEPEIGRVEEETSLWCSHEQGKSRMKAELSCGQRLLSPGF